MHETQDCGSSSAAATATAGAALKPFGQGGATAAADLLRISDGCIYVQRHLRTRYMFGFWQRSHPVCDEPYRWVPLGVSLEILVAIRVRRAGAAAPQHVLCFATPHHGQRAGWAS
jgi:hypothetical protein